MNEHLLRVARLQWQGIRRNRVLLVTHAMALFTLLVLTLNRIILTGSEGAGGLAGGLLLIAVCGTPVSVGAHVLVHERSRGTLEALLLLPISKVDLLTGKALAIYGIALVETAVVGVALLLALWLLPGLSAALWSWPVAAGLVLLILLLGCLLTAVVMVASGRTTDPQTASSMALLVSGPMMAAVIGLWFGLLLLRPALLVLLVLGTTLLLFVTLRAALALLTDEALVARRN